MKLVTFKHAGDRMRLGALVEGDGGPAVVDLQGVDAGLPDNMIAFLAGGEAARSRAERAVREAPAQARLPLGSVELCAPIPLPGKIICIGQNYAAHAAESNSPPPPYPIIFAKYSNTVTAPGGPIRLPRITEQVDYEAELGVVIGRRAFRVPESEALNYVGGYLPFNDVSARDYQRLTSQWTIGKTFDTFAPMGPALVTADEVPDPQNLDVRLSIGGEVLQSGNTSDMIFSVAHLIAFASAVMTLEPGDIIATGTPPGVGFARKPPRWLRAGDVVRIEISGLGVLENPVVGPD
jgi:acylpyruvate hydrolase